MAPQRPPSGGARGERRALRACLKNRDRRSSRFALVLSAVAILLSAAAALLVGQPAQAVIGQAASGDGISPLENTPAFHFSAVGGPGTAGGGATGTMLYLDNRPGGAPTIVADVKCLFVSGNRATVVGLITGSSIPPPEAGSVGDHMTFFVEDNGSPGAGQDRWLAVFGAASETSCTHFTLGPPIAAGEISVTVPSTPTTPTSKQQCKKGGWRRFTSPSFKNQGQCVAYVNHHDGKGKDDQNSSGKKNRGKKK
jgi:hypothetical protein